MNLDHHEQDGAGRNRFDRRALLGAAAGLTLGLGLPGTTMAASTHQRVERALARMTITEKVSQLFVIGAAGTTMTPWFQEHLTTVRPGGVLFVGPNIGSAADLRGFLAAIHASNPNLPPLTAIDQEGGPVLRIAGDPAPGAVELGKSPDKVVRARARERAEFLGDFGFDVNFAPVADIAYRPTSYMAARSFGADPERVAAKVEDFILGARKGGIAGAAKHFPGHGRTPHDSHATIPEIKQSLAGWRDTDALPFQAAVDAGVEMVMIGHLRFPKWDTAPASLSRVAVRALRDDLGFKGVIVTDDLGMGALRGANPFEVVDRAIHAGVDLLLYASAPVPVVDLMTHLQRRVERGQIAEHRIDARLRRILTLKAARFTLRGDVKEH